MQAPLINSHRKDRLQRLRLQVMASEQAAQIGERLRERREELGLTRRALARKIEGIATENDIYRWEKGLHKPQDDTLAAVAGALGRDYAWAMGSAPNGATPDPFPASDESQLDRIEQKLDQILEALTEADQTAAIQQAFEDYANRLGREVGKRPPRSRRKEDRPPEAPPVAA